MRLHKDITVISPDFSIVTAHQDLVLYVDSLQKKNAEALSFYPKCVFERESKNGRIFLGLLNGMPCGYLYVGAPNVDVKIHQVCIEYDARKRLYGASLVVAMEDYALSNGGCSVTLRCGFDLEANNFWLSMGYSCIAVVDGGVRRMRKINIWRKQLSPALFVQDCIPPAFGKTDSSVWRKNKKPGTVTQFVRGKAMKAYRDSITGGETK